MANRIELVGVIFAALLASSAAQAGTVYANSACGDDAWSGTDQVCAAPDGPKATIQAAIDAASGGDEVLVAPGTYVESIDFTGKAIKVQSADGAAVTIIDGDLQYTGVGCTFQTGEGVTSILDGFTIRYFGAGILCD